MVKITISVLVNNIHFYAKFEDFTDAVNYIDTILPEIIEEDIMLPTGYLGYTIAWDSEKSEVLNEFGMFNRPYREEVVKLIAEIKINVVIFYKEFELPTVGYKKLDSNIMSSYVFLEFNNVSDDFYDYHEIVNVAFAIADSNLNFNTSNYPNYFNDISNYIFPKAKETATWVIMSIGPESSWSQIASNPTKVDLFCDKIVELINTYGFDGVDIDWELLLRVKKLYILL